MTSYRTQEARTPKILGKWIHLEQLAFKLEESLPLNDLVGILPLRTKEQLGDFKPTDPVFRKLSAGFDKISDVWIELARFIGIWDFSVEQTLFGLVAVILDKENVRVKLNAVLNDASRLNSIEFICLDRPHLQGTIGYLAGSRLVFPDIIFETVIERRLNIYRLNCDYLGEILAIPSDSLTAEEATEIESERNKEAARDAHLEQLAEEREAQTAEGVVLDLEELEAGRMADVFSADDSILLDENQ